MFVLLSSPVCLVAIRVLSVSISDSNVEFETIFSDLFGSEVSSFLWRDIDVILLSACGLPSAREKRRIWHHSPCLYWCVCCGCLQEQKKPAAVGAGDMMSEMQRKLAAR